MKTTITKLFFTILILFSVLTGFSQDVITKKDKSEIKGKVVEIGLDEIKYIPEGVTDGPLIVVDKIDILKIKYASGQEWFNAPDVYNVSPTTEVRDKTKAIKFEFFSPLFGKLTFGYEQMITVGTNAEFKLGIIGPSLNKESVANNPSGVFVKLGPKFLLGSEYRMRGVSYAHPLVGKYFKPEIIFSTFKQDYTYSSYNVYNNGINTTVPGGTSRYNTTSFAICLNFGKQYILGNAMTLDWYVGIGYGFQDTGKDELVQQSSFYDYTTSTNYVEYCYSHFYGGPSFPMAFQGGLTLGFLAR